MTHGGATSDPSSPTTVRLTKWAVFSVGLALVGLVSDAIATAPQGAITWQSVLGRGELLMVSISMLFSAAGELLYDRTRLAIATAGEATLITVTFMICLFPVGLFWLARAGAAPPGLVMRFSLTFFAISLAWGCVVIWKTDR